MRKHLTIAAITQSLSLVIGLVLIWRGIWYVLDWVDKILFEESHVITAVGGILLGLVILWLPDGDLKEIQKL